MPPPIPSTGLAITNPLVLYRSLLATKRIEPDPAQHRLALHLGSLYDSLKDYEPAEQYAFKLQQISQALDQPDSHSRGPAGLNGKGVLSSLLDRQGPNDGLSLTRVLSSHESALEVDSPKGLMLHGEVGTGKSMLIDLFADCLPNRKKRRWHFTTFMLETMARLEQLRRDKTLSRRAIVGQQDDYSLVWLARDLVSSSPIIFLDEFQLPDRTASRIMTNLMTAFFQLGGVLIATSNRMPEELAKAAGMEWTPEMPRFRPGSLASRLGLGGGLGKSETMYQGKTDFARFLEVLRARCEVWEMEGTRDYRRRDVEPGLDGGVEELEDMAPGNIGLGYEQSRPAAEKVAFPRNYFIQSEDVAAAVGEALEKAQLAAVGLADTTSDAATSAARAIPWEPSSMRIYGRDVAVPRQYNGVTCWNFEELCVSVLGPADYISLAAKYHTLILLDVPQLKLLQKREARRFITLLDALYEARCKLLISAAAGPDDVFFADPRKASDDDDGEEVVDQDATYAETLSEVYQDATAPFRPNVSFYDDSSSGTPSASSFSSSSADDPYYYDKGPDYTHSRLAGILSDERDHGHNPPDQLEDQPPNMLKRGDSIYGRDDLPPVRRPAVDHRSPVMPGDRRVTGPDFQQAGVFTGEDEKFAYKRARSRLWEMTGERWWSRGVLPDGTVEEVTSWWRPLDESARTWERPVSSYSGPGRNVDEARTAVPEGMGPSAEINPNDDEVLFRHGASPFRTHSEPPPKMGWEHVWGMVRWGKRAGTWGKGVEGVDERRREKENGKGGDDK